MEQAPPLPPWDEAKDRVFIALRPFAFLQALGDVPILAQRSLPLLAETVVLEREGTFTYLTTHAVEAWSITPEQLFDVARLNVAAALEHALEPLEDEEQPTSGGHPREPPDPPAIYRCSSGDAFESSRLVSLPILAKIRESLEAPALFCSAPERDTLLVAIDASPPTLVRLMKTTEDVYRESQSPVSPALYVFTSDGDLGPLELADDHPLRERVRRGHLLLVDAEYGAQKQSLEERLHEQGIELFVATHFAVERESGQVFSYASWTEGPQALLPYTDLVVFAFGGEERSPLVVTWEAAEALASDFWEEVEGMEPPRRRTLGFPDAETIEKLAMYAVDL